MTKKKWKSELQLNAKQLQQMLVYSVARKGADIEVQCRHAGKTFHDIGDGYKGLIGRCYRDRETVLGSTVGDQNPLSHCHSQRFETTGCLEYRE